MLCDTSPAFPEHATLKSPYKPNAPAKLSNPFPTMAEFKNNTNVNIQGGFFGKIISTFQPLLGSAPTQSIRQITATLLKLVSSFVY